MGQYYKICNLDTKSMLVPHDLGDGAKLMEFGSSGLGTMTALASLLVLNQARRSPWAGQRIAVVGDYADEGRFLPLEQAAHNLYTVASGYAPDPTKVVEGADADSDEVPCLPAYENAKDQAQQQLNELGYPELLREGPSCVTGLKQMLAQPKRVFEQPEDVLEALDLPPSQNGTECVEGILRECRIQGVTTPYAWCRAFRSTWELSDDGARIEHWHVQYVEQDHPRTPSAVRTLNFPATAKQVAKWMGVGASTFR